jgi:hypothetical protein
MVYRTRMRASLMSPKAVTVVTSGNPVDSAGDLPSASGNSAVTRMVTENLDSSTVAGTVTTAVTGLLPVTPEKFPEKSRQATTVTTVTGNLNKRESVVAKIRNAWRRIFGIDVEKRREVAGLPCVADHLKPVHSQPTPLADALLRQAEIESAIQKRVLGLLQKSRQMRRSDLIGGIVLDDSYNAKDFDRAVATLQNQNRVRIYGDDGDYTVEICFPEEEAAVPHVESKEPGSGPCDVFRIFGNKARTILTDANWLEIAENHRKAIEEEAVQWALRNRRWRRNVPLPIRVNGQPAICRHCAKKKSNIQPWHKNGRIVEKVEAGGRRVLACHYCGQSWKPKKGKINKPQEQIRMRL